MARIEDFQSKIETTANGGEKEDERASGGVVGREEE
jgi:hypothetical protein